MAGWSPATIGDAVEPISTWTPERDDPSGIFAYIDLSAIDQDAKVITGSRELPCAQAPSRARQIVRTGDVLVSTVRPSLNGVAQVPRELDGATASTGFCVLRPRTELLDSQYLFQWVRSPQFVGDMVRNATGASYPAISDRIIRNSRFVLPPIAEQRRIGAILDKADALRAKRREALAQLDTLMQSIFLDMFGDPATNPKRWPVSQVGTLCAEVIDCPHATPVYALERTNYACIRSSDIQNGELVFVDTKYVEHPEYEKRVKRGKPKAGDVVYCREGARFGNAALIPNDGNLCLGQRMMLLRPNPRMATGAYIWALLSSPAVYRQAAQLVGGSASPHVNIRDIVAFRVPNPPVSMQRGFARRVASIAMLKSAQRTSAQELDALFASLQHRAFRAEL